MPFLALHVVFSFVLDLLHLVTQRDHDRALELLLLRQQLRLYERQAPRPRPPRWDKVALAAIAAKLPHLSRVCLVFTPATLLCMVYRLRDPPRFTSHRSPLLTRAA